MEGCPLLRMAFFYFYLYSMSRLIVGLICMGLCWTAAKSQVSYLDRPDILKHVESCLDHTYGFSFIQAKREQLFLANLTPEHPAPLFLDALIIYWKHYPLTPEKEESEQFIALMEKCVEMAEGYMDNDQTHLEGVFFDLFGRAFQAMFWADNGKPFKVVSDLGTMYQHTKEGFQLKDEFVEFYFSTGLYNYYIEAYPEARPFYKPMVSFMEEGDKKLGLEQLEYAIKHSVYLKVESQLFMTIVQLNYEANLSTALHYISRLHHKYPRNTYYKGLLLTILLHQDNYTEARKVLLTLNAEEGDYSVMVKTMAKAFLSEKFISNDLQAKKGYLETLEMADSFGPIADMYKAIAYMGLSRISIREEMDHQAKKYARMAANHTVYSFILNE
jgi:hypothetical protein